MLACLCVLLECFQYLCNPTVVCHLHDDKVCVCAHSTEYYEAIMCWMCALSRSQLWIWRFHTQRILHMETMAPLVALGLVLAYSSLLWVHVGNFTHTNSLPEVKGRMGLSTLSVSCFWSFFRIKQTNNFSEAVAGNQIHIFISGCLQQSSYSLYKKYV